MKLKISCKKTPCELSWIILQPSVVVDDVFHSSDQLVEVNKDKNHALVRVYCNNPDLAATFADSLLLYTTSRYTRFSTKSGLAYFLFNNE
jgi:hypothetical protein